MQTTCQISGKTFTVSDHEMALRKQFGLDTPPTTLPKYRFRHLGAFWPHWNFYKRKCDKTGKDIVSIFRPDCPYPIWQRDEWFEHADPPSQDFDFEKPFFDQAWELFQKCPLPHIFQTHNQNCEYTDDWYHSKNCYLCHSGEYCEDCRYCYGCSGIKTTHNAVFSFECERCYDVINSTNCYNSFFLLNCKNVSDSAFLYDCRDCSDCLFSFNLRNKKYCFANEQLTKEEFEKKKQEWDFSSHKTYEHAKEYFAQMMKDFAWHRALQIDLCENSSGNFIHHSKDCENCYMLSYHENCANVCFSGPHAKSILDSLGTVGGELTYMCSLPVFSYDARFSFSVSHCHFVQYSAYLQNCQYCFGCCGLVNKKYCILNKQYTKEEYEMLVPKIIEHMKTTQEYEQFFPGHFAPNPYTESYSGFHYPLTEQNQSDYRTAPSLEKKSIQTATIEEIPDSSASLNSDQERWLMQQVFWDEQYERPFRIDSADIQFAKEMKVPLPHTYYINRIQSNFRWMPFSEMRVERSEADTPQAEERRTTKSKSANADYRLRRAQPICGELRETTCAKSGHPITTNWPESFDGRILSEEEYLKLIR